MDVVQPPTRSNSSAGSAAAGDDAEALRIYQAWEGSNVFLLSGRFIFGPDARSIFLTIFLITAPVAVFCVFVARKLRNHFSHHLGILIMAFVIALTIYVLVVLLMTSGRDPGIIPRSLHPPEPDPIDQDIEAGTGQTPPFRLPRIKEVVVNGMTVKIKYCDTCKLYRPPRCSHCSICDNCVERFDHHCPWVGQCIGRRNYRFFFMFVSSATVLCVYVFAFCWVYVVKIMNSEDTTIWKALAKTPASIVLIAYTFIAVWFVGGLTVFHLYLIGTNQSTYENFRYRYDRQANPFNKGVMENFKEIFWTSIPPSKNKFRARVPRESEIKPRVGGGRLVNPNIEKTMSDLEMSRKPTSNEAATGINDAEGQQRNSDQYGEVSPSTGTEGRFVSQPMRYSWGRRSGSWEIPSEVVAIASGLGNSNQSNSSGNLTVGSRSDRQ